MTICLGSLPIGMMSAESLKGRVQLLVQLKWVDLSVVPGPRKIGESYAFYDPSHAKSVRFTSTSDAASVDTSSAWVKRNFL